MEGRDGGTWWRDVMEGRGGGDLVEGAEGLGEVTYLVTAERVADGQQRLLRARARACVGVCARASLLMCGGVRLDGPGRLTGRIRVPYPIRILIRVACPSRLSESPIRVPLIQLLRRTAARGRK